MNDMPKFNEDDVKNIFKDFDKDVGDDDEDDEKIN